MLSSLFWDLLVLAAGLYLLTRGADSLVSGATAIALRLGVSPLVIGLTIVAMGTSMPEMAASVAAAAHAAAGEAGAGDIAVGNVVGSNICNVALILGLAAVLAPMTMDRLIRQRDIPAMLLLSVLAIVAAWDGTLSQGEGFALMLTFSAYMAVVVYSAVLDTRRYSAHVREDVAGELARAEVQAAPTWRPALSIGLGLILLLVGADVTVGSALGLARLIGVSEAVIGLTVVAVGTSLPELVTSIVAALQRRPDIALGNVVGSNIFNIGGVLGVSAAMTSLEASRELVRGDMVVMVGLSLALVVLAVKRPTVGRRFGMGLLAVYGLWLGWLVVRQAGILLP